MVSQNDILQFAHDKDTFSANDLVKYFESIGIKFSKDSLYKRLRRMVSEGYLLKPSFGLYSVPTESKTHFIPCFSKEMEEIESFIKCSYPFLDLCIWNLMDIKSLSHYVSKADIIYVEVDRDAMEGVFSRLSDFIKERRVFLTPSENDYPLYVNSQPSIVVKPLISQAPLLKSVQGSSRTSIEKILVDVVSDSDFIPWQGYESLRLYETAFDRYNINTSKLTRYASRRGKSEEVKQTIEDIKNIED